MTLTEIIKAHLLENGYVERKGADGYVAWTRPEWKDWWVTPRTGTKSDREESLSSLVSWILYQDSLRGQA